MDDILIKIGVIALVLIVVVSIYIAIRKRKIVFVDDTKRKGTVDIQHSQVSSEKELPTKFTKKQLKRVEKYEEKVDNLEKKNSELDKKVKELSNQLEALRKSIKVLQELKVEPTPNVHDNPSTMSSSIANKKETTIDKEHPVKISYEYLTIGGDGNLIHCEEGYTIYYRAWKERNNIKFEFVNSDRTKKAINNRSTYIEPFCSKAEESKLPDESNNIETMIPGILNNDFTVKEKAVIKYK